MGEKEGMREGKEEGKKKEMGLGFRDLKAYMYSGSWEGLGKSMQRGECSEREWKEKS